MSHHKLPLPGSVLYAVGKAIYDNGAPMTSLAIFAQVRYCGGHDKREVVINKAVATGLLTAVGNRFSLTAMALAHFDGTGDLPAPAEIVCSVATSRTTNGLTAPPLSKRHQLSSNINWARRDVRLFSLNSGVRP